MPTNSKDRIVSLLKDMEGPVELDAADLRMLVNFAASYGKVETAVESPSKEIALDFRRWFTGRFGDGFPEGRHGDISGYNGLFRINWFNGRYLTAEAFKAQDIYWDHRTRFLGRIFPQGVSWGLGLSIPGARPPGYSELTGRRGNPHSREGFDLR